MIRQLEGGEEPSGVEQRITALTAYEFASAAGAHLALQHGHAAHSVCLGPHSGWDDGRAGGRRVGQPLSPFPFAGTPGAPGKDARPRAPRESPGTQAAPMQGQPECGQRRWVRP